MARKKKDERYIGGIVVADPLVPSDEHWNDVTLLLDGDGTSGSTTFTDQSSALTSVSNNSNNVTVNTTTKKFGSGSIQFDGASDWLYFSDLYLGTDDFTIETWLNVDISSSPQYAQIIGNEDGISGWTWLINGSSASAGDMQLYCGANGLTLQTSSGVLSSNTWHHVALAKTGNTVKFFVDGTEVATDDAHSFDFTNDAASTAIGRNLQTTPRNLVGYMDDFRITKGVARYTAAFTPPTASFPTTADPIRPGVFNLGGGSADGESTTRPTRRWGGIIGRSLLADGDSLVENSLRFDGTADYLEWSPPTDGNMDKWTWSGWVKRHVTGTATRVFGAGSGTSAPYLHFSFSSTSGEVDTLRFDQVKSGGIVDIRVKSKQTFASTDTWYHVIVSYDSLNSTAANRLKWWVNGQSVDTDETNGRVYPSSGRDTLVNDATYSMWLGRNHNSYGAMTLAEVHFLDGYALQETTPSITVDTFGETRDGVWVPKEVTGITYGTNGFYLDYKGNGTGVTLLLDGSSTTDKSSAGNNVTLTGATANDQVTDQFGGTSGSFSFVVSGDYITVPNAAVDDWGTDDWTVELWVKPTSTASRQILCGSTPSSGDTADSHLMIDLDSTGYWDVYVGDGTSWNQINGTIAATTSWQHVAAVRNGQTVSLFVDGAFGGSATVTHGVARGTTTPFRIGRTGDYTLTDFAGYIADFRITKGYARYTGSFTPPTSALTNTPEYLGDFGVDRTTNNNNFTVEGNITPDDQLLDTPNLRFATWDPATLTHASGTGDLTESNLKWVGTGGNDTVFASEAKSSGKWYYEAYLNSNAAQAVLGWSTTAERDVTSPIVSAQSAYFITAGIRKTNTTVVWGSTLGNDGQSVTIADNDVFGFAIDISSGTLDIYRNGTLITSPALTLPSNKGTEFLPIIGDASSTDSTITANFGQDHTFSGAKPTLLTPYSDANGNGEFYHEPPSGFLALAEYDPVTVTRGSMSLRELYQSKL